jgi:hypothetical protein
LYDIRRQTIAIDEEKYSPLSTRMSAIIANAKSKKKPAYAHSFNVLVKFDQIAVNPNNLAVVKG